MLCEIDHQQVLEILGKIFHSTATIKSKSQLKQTNSVRNKGWGCKSSKKLLSKRPHGIVKLVLPFQNSKLPIMVPRVPAYHYQAAAKALSDQTKTVS